MNVTDDFGNLVGGAHIKTIYERLESGDVRMGSIEADLAANTAATKANTAATQEIADGVKEIIAFFAAMKGGLKVLGWLGKLAKPLTALVALGLTLWSAYLAYRNGVGGGR